MSAFCVCMRVFVTINCVAHKRSEEKKANHGQFFKLEVTLKIEFNMARSRKRGGVREELINAGKH